jgi:hypothetical protein
MADEVTCPLCDASISGEDDAQLIANFRQHARDEEHPLPIGMPDEEFDAEILANARGTEITWTWVEGG